MLARGALVILVGCSFQHGRLPGGVGPGDAGADTPADTDADVPVLPCGWSYLPTGADPCETPAPTETTRLCTGATITYATSTEMFDGRSTVLDTSTEPAVRVVSLLGLEVCSNTILRITGPYPLRVLVHGAVEIAGTIEVSSWQDGSQVWQPGPGGNLCTVGTGATGNGSGAGASGGGGGGFGAQGGDSGPGDVVAAVVGGMPEGDASLLPLRGGCAGGNGGIGDNTSVGRGGPGGGAIQIAARETFEITGSIRAAGAPGLGGRGADCGGGGGGSGGAILLEAKTISIDAAGAVCANGGGGGGGANDGGPFNAGGDGSPGTCSLSAAAAGAGGNNNGQPGGKGGFGTTPAEPGLGADEGGGGGGGAVGRIRIRAIDAPVIAGVVTPPAS